MMLQQICQQTHKPSHRSTLEGCDQHKSAPLDSTTPHLWVNMSAVTLLHPKEHHPAQKCTFQRHRSKLSCEDISSHATPFCRSSTRNHQRPCGILQSRHVSSREANMFVPGPEGPHTGLCDQHVDQAVRFRVKESNRISTAHTRRNNPMPNCVCHRSLCVAQICDTAVSLLKYAIEIDREQNTL